MIVTGALPLLAARAEAGPLLVLLAAISSGPGPVLAVLADVNIGPNLTYAGSLATLLWPRLLARTQPSTGPGQNHPARTGIVPAGLALATTAFRLALHLTGHG